MAIDMTKTVSNILSGSGEAALQNIDKVIRTVADLVKLPGIDLDKLRKLPGLDGIPGLDDILGAAPDLEKGLGFGASKRQTRKPKRQFNPFSLADMRRSATVAVKLMEIAERKGGDAGLADAVGALGSLGELMGEVSGLVGSIVGDPKKQVSDIVKAVGVDALGLLGLRQHALELFITHYPPARQKFRMPSFEQRQPSLACPSPAGSTPPEDQMDYWREDVPLNDHHGKWHLVHPTGGRPVPGSNINDIGDRHGELFAYMHEQMLARYDAERLGVGLPRVKPFDDYQAQIPEGYDPGDLMEWNGGQWVGFVKRPDNAGIKDFGPPLDRFLIEAPGAKIADMERFRDALLEAARRGRYELLATPVDVTSDNIGNTVEASLGSVDYPVKEEIFHPDNGKNYGDLHNIGHMHFSYFENEDVPSGVMTDLDVTSRDPVFWRWHKHADNILQTWRKTLGEREPYDFAEGLPVTVRDNDIILCGEGGLTDKKGLPADFDDRRLGSAAFAGYLDDEPGQWEKDFPSGKTTFTVVLERNPDRTVKKSAKKEITTTAELTTEMRTRTIQVYDSKSKKMVPRKIKYLSHEDFYYFIRLQNRSQQAQQVTVRIFLAPEPWVDDNTAWIELDRFLHRLAGNERAVLFRPARLSAVIRKPALGHAELESTKPRPPATTWCDCGWPYTLLLPRSTKEGMDFRLLVMLTSNDLVMTDTGQECTSVSYCGVQDVNYPDKRLMGYPFDRSLPDSINSIIGKHDNWASRPIRIRCRNL